MRLLDRIFSGELVKEARFLVPELAQAELVIIDNVTDYFYEMVRLHQTGDSIPTSSFPNVVSPFDVAFLEMRPRLPGTFFPDVYDEAGLLIKMYTAEKFHQLSADPSFSLQSWPRNQSGTSAFELEAPWFITARLFLRVRDRHEVFHAANFTAAVNHQGQVIETAQGGWVDIWLANTFGLSQSQQEYFGMAFSTLCFCPALLAISFMHCRNVQAVEQVPPPKLSKKHEKKTGRPLLRYRVLQIDHMKEVLEKEGGASKTGLKRALHICRGHFAHYGQDGKGLLFGKYAGTVWVPMHTRGTKEKGVVVKDYDVK